MWGKGCSVGTLRKDASFGSSPLLAIFCKVEHDKLQLSLAQVWLLILADLQFWLTPIP